MIRSRPDPAVHGGRAYVVRAAAAAEAAAVTRQRVDRIESVFAIRFSVYTRQSSLAGLIDLAAAAAERKKERKMAAS